MPESKQPPPPQVGMVLQDSANHGTRLFRVIDVFPAGSYPGMLIEWDDDDSPGGLRAQAFTTKDWQRRWSVVTDKESATRPVNATQQRKDNLNEHE